MRYNYEKEKFTDFNKKKYKVEILDTDMMSTFYKDYLNNRFAEHQEYNKEWTRKNFRLLKPALKLALYRMYCRLYPKKQ